MEDISEGPTSSLLASSSAVSEGQGEGDAQASLLLISWNVAGWASTKALVQRHYGSLDKYLERLGSPAILCLQETKVQEKDMKNEVAAKSLGALLENYRSFWSFNLASNRDGKGVATWVRKDIPCLGATQSVLGIPDFDNQGRLLATDHGDFVVVNVYAPFVGNSGSQEVEAKLRFLEALQTALERLRQGGRKRVFLCGDLNLTHRLEDQQLLRRVVKFDGEGLLRVHNKELGPYEDWCDSWVSSKEVSARAEVPAEELSAEAECVHVRESGCVPWLRKMVQPPKLSEWADVFAEVHPDAKDRFTAWSQTANLRYVNLGTRIDYVLCDRATFQDCVVASSANALAGGEKPVSSPSSLSSSSLSSSSSSLAGTALPLPEDGGPLEAASSMARIGEARSDQKGPTPTATASTLSSQAALNAATNFGGWHASASFGIARGEGLGLQVDDMRLNDSQFPARPHTGLIYTPPAYSDHIAVSVLLKRAPLLSPPQASPNSSSPEPWAGEAASASSSLSETSTKRSQPWTMQRGIASFFGGGGGAFGARGNSSSNSSLGSSSNISKGGSSSSSKTSSSNNISAQSSHSAKTAAQSVQTAADATDSTSTSTSTSTSHAAEASTPEAPEATTATPVAPPKAALIEKTPELRRTVASGRGITTATATSAATPDATSVATSTTAATAAAAKKDFFSSKRQASQKEEEPENGEGQETAKEETSKARAKTKAKAKAKAKAEGQEKKQQQEKKKQQQPQPKKRQQQEETPEAKPARQESSKRSEKAAGAGGDPAAKRRKKS